MYGDVAHERYVGTSPCLTPLVKTTSRFPAQEAEARLQQFGPNEPAAAQHHSILTDLLHPFVDPLLLILVIAAVASAFLGEKVDAGIIATIVLLSAAIDFGQTYRSQQAIEHR
jgi:magnesium-transporting ATPase (P-type)